VEVELSYQLSKRSKTLQVGGVGKIPVGGGVEVLGGGGVTREIGRCNRWVQWGVLVEVWHSSAACCRIGSWSLESHLGRA
jgi:hypothetical protein